MTKRKTPSQPRSILIRTTPPIKDPKELDSIITASLRSLYGDYQPYSCGLRVVECRKCSPAFAITGYTQEQEAKQSYDAVLECPSSSEKYIRAALTFSSIPPFLEGTVYRLDFLESKCVPGDMTMNGDPRVSG